jgi:uncharacterized protein (TIGR03435 family)
MRHLSSKVVLVVAAIAAAVMPVAAQAPQSVTVKPDPYGQSLKTLITYAYQVLDFQIVGGPDWAGIERWDIQSKPDAVVAWGFPLLVQSVLEDHFHLKAHPELRESPIYELVVAPGGTKVRLADNRVSAAGPTSGIFMTGDDAGLRFEGNAISLAQLVDMLTAETGRIVIDKTGLQGLYDMQMEWAPSRIPLTTAIEEQLGLRLQAATGPVEVLVIDSVQKPSEN